MFHLIFREEAQENIDIGALNGLFVLGRSMGFIGEYTDRVWVPVLVSVNI